MNYVQLILTATIRNILKIRKNPENGFVTHYLIVSIRQYYNYKFEVILMLCWKENRKIKILSIRLINYLFSIQNIMCVSYPEIFAIKR